MMLKRLSSLLVTVMFVLSLIALNLRLSISSPDPVISVSPPTNIYNVDQLFKVNITIAGVASPGINAWELKLGFDSSILYVNKVVEGTFLKGLWIAVPPPGHWQYQTYFSYYVGVNYIQLAQQILTNDNVIGSGSGVLATVEFKVVDTGKSILDLYDTLLRDKNLNSIAHTSTDGEFYTTYPRADFTYSPSVEAWEPQGPTFRLPVRGEAITFNASRSYDPDGSIINYQWNFGDGNTTNTGDPIITHAYSDEGSYTVVLTVTDNASPPKTDTKDRSVTVVVHDIAITNIRVFPSLVYPSGLVYINVTILNQGSIVENFNLTTYYDDSLIPYNLTLFERAYTTFGKTALLAHENTTITYTWNTTEVAEGIYTIRANASLLNPSTKEFISWLEQDLNDNSLVDGTVRVSLGVPLAAFTVSPQQPLAGKTVTFNATDSEDFDGTIVDYTWNFGDGTTSGGSNPVTTHTYAKTGTFTVILNVTDNEAQTGSALKQITVLVHDVTVKEVSVAPTSVKIGEIFSIGVNVKNIGNFTETFNVTSYYDSTLIDTHPNVVLLPGKNQTVAFTWNTTGVSAGNYNISAQASEVLDEGFTNNNIYVFGTVTVEKHSSEISVFAYPQTIVIGAKVTINGTITPTRLGATVTILYKTAGGSWSTLETTTTDQNGRYTYDWTPTTPGTYEVKATWEGDTLYLSDESDALTVTIGETPSNVLFYVAVGVAVILVVILLVYFVKVRKRT